MKRPGLLAAPFLIAIGGTAWADSFSYTATDNPQLIPVLGGTFSTLIVPTGGGFDTIEDLNILVDISHGYCSDLEIRLRHDDTGTTVALILGRGADGDGFDGVTLDDEASQPISDFTAPGTGQSFRPEVPLAAFIGESVTGSWTLIVEDLYFLDSGVLHTFSISGTASAVTTPEPGTYAMFGLGALGLGGLALRRRRAAAAAAVVPSAS